MQTALRRALSLAAPLLVLAHPGHAGEVVLTEASELHAPDGAAGDAFGSAVAGDGPWLVVGAIGDDDQGASSGSAYVFQHAAGGWVLAAKLVASDGASNDRFGYAVALQGELLAVGAPGDDDLGNESGAVYLYRLVGGAWTFDAKLVPPDSTPNQQYGNAVALHGERLVSAAHRQAVAGSDSGAVYVHRRGAGGWQQETKLVPYDAFSYDQFGFSLDYDGERALIGAFHDDDLGSSSGSAYVWARSGSSWSFERKLVQHDGIAFDELGFAVAIEGDLALAGAPGADAQGSGSGAAYAYTRSGNSWEERQKLLAPGGAASDFYGSQLAIFGRRCLVACPRDDSAASNAGALVLWERCGSQWLARAELRASDAAPNDLLGNAPAVALDGERAYVGSPTDEDLANQAGSLYVFELAALPFQGYCEGDGSAAPCPCGNDSTAGAGQGCRNSSGSGARLLALGSPSVADDDLVLHACQLPPGRPLIWIAGLAAANGGQGLPFGDGLLCIAGARSLLGLVLADASGTAALGPGLAAAHGFQPGDLRYLQVRYRDPFGGPCGSRFNATGGILALFAP